jgi:hypothetical protein
MLSRPFSEPKQQQGRRESMYATRGKHAFAAAVPGISRPDCSRESMAPFLFCGQLDREEFSTQVSDAHPIAHGARNHSPFAPIARYTFLRAVVESAEANDAASR